MKTYNVKVTTYNVSEDYPHKHQMNKEKIVPMVFKDKKQAKKEIDYMNRSSVNKTGTIKKYNLTR